MDEQDYIIANSLVFKSLAKNTNNNNEINTRTLNVLPNNNLTEKTTANKLK